MKTSSSFLLLADRLPLPRPSPAISQTESAFSCETAAISATAPSDKVDWQDHAWRRRS